MAVDNFGQLVPAFLQIDEVVANGDQDLRDDFRRVVIMVNHFPGKAVAVLKFQTRDKRAAKFFVFIRQFLS